jgi:hypothetical protein
MDDRQEEMKAQVASSSPGLMPSKKRWEPG